MRTSITVAAAVAVLSGLAVAPAAAAPPKAKPCTTTLQAGADLYRTAGAPDGIGDVVGDAVGTQQVRVLGAPREPGADKYEITSVDPAGLVYSPPLYPDIVRRETGSAYVGPGYLEWTKKFTQCMARRG